MNSRPDAGDRFLWAARGREWGFRFLRRSGLDDPLPAYEEAFAAIGDRSEGWSRVGNRVALRFPDPEGREDAAGRVIPHDFVLFGSLAEGIDSLDAGRGRIWPRVADEFARIWDHGPPPSASE